MDTRALTVSRPPTVTVWANPLEPIATGTPLVARAGTPIAELFPSSLEGWHVACTINGRWISRDDWHWPALDGDVIEFHVRVNGGGNGLAAVLQIAAIIAINYFLPGSGALEIAGRIGATVASSYLINAVFGKTPQSASSSQTRTLYSATLGNNEATLDGPVPVLYGYTKTAPKFGCQPYVENTDTDDQYYHALFILGHGVYAKKRVMIGKSDIAAFSDVDWEWLEPGQAPTIVNPAVVTSSEVSGQDLLTGEYVGGFVVCNSRRAATHIGIDIFSPALGIANDSGGMTPRTVSWRVDYRPVDDFARPIGPWAQLAIEELTAATTSPVRRSYKYALAAPARVAVRIVRLDIKDDNSRNYDDVQWTGLRGYLSNPAPLCASATHLAVRIRANEQLSSFSQNQFYVICIRMLRTWSKANGFSAELVETRNPAWALADKWTDSITGDGLLQSECDLETLEALAPVWEARQDRFDYAFSDTTDSDSADQLIATAGRARVFRRHGVRSVVRDALVDLPVAAFGGVHMLPGAWSQTSARAVADSPDGIRLMYRDNRSGEMTPIDCPAPGVAVMTRPEVVELAGVTGPTHAQREGRFLAACLVYRRDTFEWQTELQGTLPTFGSVIKFAPLLAQWLQSGSIVGWDEATLTATLSEPPRWEAGATHYISLIETHGGVSGAIQVGPGLSAHDVILAAAPSADITFDSPDREPTVYVFGTAAQHAQDLVRISGIEPGDTESDGAPLITMHGFLENAAVHLVDNDLLPADGEIQDPIDDGSGTGDSAGVLIMLLRHSIGGGPLIGARYIGQAALTLGNNGKSHGTWLDWLGGTHELVFPGEWAGGGEIDVATASGYEVSASVISRSGTGFEAVPVGSTIPGSLATVNGPLDAWVSLADPRTWTLVGSDFGLEVTGTTYSTAQAVLRVRIREVATGVEQAVGDFTLWAQGTYPEDPSAGGGGI